MFFGEIQKLWKQEKRYAADNRRHVGTGLPGNKTDYMTLCMTCYGISRYPRLGSAD